MSKVKYDTIILEGMDKSGKSTIFKYIGQMDRSYVLQDRGLLSCVTYDRIYKRKGKDYDFNSHKNEVYFVLFPCEEDWKIRCKLEHEPPMEGSYQLNSYEFEKSAQIFKESGIKVYLMGTSYKSPFTIAQEILGTMEDLNGGNEDSVR